MIADRPNSIRSRAYRRHRPCLSARDGGWGRSAVGIDLYAPASAWAIGLLQGFPVGDPDEVEQPIGDGDYGHRLDAQLALTHPGRPPLPAEKPARQG